MLSRADAAAQGGSGVISRLEDELARAQAARISAEAATAQALAAKAAGERGGEPGSPVQAAWRGWRGRQACKGASLQGRGDLQPPSTARHT